MFDKLKQLGQLKQLQEELGKESISVNSTEYGEKLSLTITGKQEIQNIHINQELMNDQEKLSVALTDLVNKGIKESHQLMVNKMQSGNFNLPQM